MEVARLAPFEASGVVGRCSHSLITSSFKPWLEIENLSNEELVIARPALRARSLHLPASRWYVDGSRGMPWDGHVRARETAR